MDEEEFRSTDEIRDDLDMALNGETTIDETVGVFYNGDWEYVRVIASEGKLSIHNEKWYRLIDNRVVELTGVYTLIHELNTLVDASWMRKILNMNLDVLPTYTTEFFMEDEDRGLYPMIVYRLNGEFHVIEADDDGTICIPRSLLKEITKYSDYRTWKQVIENYDISVC